MLDKILLKLGIRKPPLYKVGEKLGDLFVIASYERAGGEWLYTIQGEYSSLSNVSESTLVFCNKLGVKQ